MGMNRKADCHKTHIGCIKSIDSCSITCDDRIHRQNQITISRILYITYAASMCLIDSSSGKIHPWNSLEP